jgi:hypothetical protein
MEAEEATTMVKVLYALAALGSWWLAFTATLTLGYRAALRGEESKPLLPIIAVLISTALMVLFIVQVARQ